MQGGSRRPDALGLVVLLCLVVVAARTARGGGDELPPPKVIRHAPPASVRPRRPPGPVVAPAVPERRPVPAPGAGAPPVAPPVAPPAAAPPTRRAPGAPLPPPVVRVVVPGRTAPPALEPRVARAPVAAPGNAVARPSGAAPSPPSPGAAPVGPSAPPPRPPARIAPRPEDLDFTVDSQGGTMRWYPDGDGRIALVMMGNPRIRGFAHRRPDGQRVEDLDVKANTVVAWIDRTRLGDAGVLSGLEGLDRKAASPDGTAPPEAAPPETSTPEPAPPGRSPPGSRTDASVLQEAVLGLYAEGAVELTYGDLAFRSERLYLEPPTYKALLLEPRFTAKGTPPRSPGAAHEDALRGAGAQGMTKTSPLEGLPLYVRARWARLVGKGVAVFDDSEVSVSRADDRLALEVGRLVVEEEQPAPGEAADGELGRVPTLLGFRRVPDQRYHAEGVELRGERVPLAYWGSATFSYPFEANLPVRVRRVTYGNRSSQGRYANVTLGGRAGPAGRPWFDWGVLVGGYSKRGPAAGADIEWDHDQTRGSAQLWGIYEFGRRDDASGFFAPHPFRWLAELESRSHVLPHTTFDAFVNDFSDAGVNLEYFENDALTEQDRESYVRTRWEQQLWVATLDAKWHQRSFVTETEELPQVDLWSSAVPLVVPGRKGAPSIDLLTHSRAGWLRRRVADGLTLPEPETARLATRTELGLGFDAGDVRISAYAGTDATEDLARTGRPSRLESAALVAGARAHLQLHRTWEVRGGWFQLDRLRHVIDLDAGFSGRWFGGDEPLESPAFDVWDLERDRSNAFVQVENRLQTRAARGGVRDVLDLDVAYHRYVDDRGPYLETSPGAIDLRLRGRPRERLYVSGEGHIDLGRRGFDEAFLGGGFSCSDAWAVGAGLRYVRDEAVAPIVDVSWRWSEKYGVRVREQYDFRSDENHLRVVFGRYSKDHAILFGASVRGEDVGVQLNVVTTVGGGGLEARRTFNDEPDPAAWGVFP